MGGFRLEQQKPLMAMVATQCIYAVTNLVAKAAFNRGLSTMVFVVYRQSIATVVLLPAILLAKRGRISELSLSLKGFGLIFLASLAGVEIHRHISVSESHTLSLMVSHLGSTLVPLFSGIVTAYGRPLYGRATVNQSLYYQGVHLASPSIASAMANLIPAITFVMAASVGLETVKLRSLRSWAKIVGTIVCVSGAMTMALYKGPKLLQMSFQNSMAAITGTSIDNWVVGGLCLIGSCSCWSLWLILTVPICKSYSDPLSLSGWTSLVSAVQAAAVTYFAHPGWSVWKLTSSSDFLAVLYAGCFGTAVTFYLQSWCISVRGPLYSAMFNPLSTVITAIFSTIILHEELHVGSLVGAIAIMGGLYVVLWGKAEDLRKMEEQEEEERTKGFRKISNTVDPECQYSDTTINHPLLTNKSEMDI